MSPLWSWLSYFTPLLLRRTFWIDSCHQVIYKMIRRFGIPLLILLSAVFLPLVLTTGMAEEDLLLHEFEHKELSEEFFCEGATFGDISGDGLLDLISGPYWFEAPDFEVKHAFYEPLPYSIESYSDCFFYFTEDFNRDGWVDIFRIGFPGEEASWYQNPGPSQNGFWSQHIVFQGVDNESPTFIDLTGDGKREMLFISEGRYGYAGPEWESPEKEWDFIPISNDRGLQKYTHGLGYGDVNGDGRLDVLEATGWYEQPQNPNEHVAWKYHPYNFAAGGSQMYAYDFDGDGDNDVITADQAHSWGLLLHENLLENGQVSFRTETIMGETPDENDYGVAFSQLHALALEDMDGDGVKDIVTGKRFWAHMGKDPGGMMAPVLYWFKTVRQEDGSVTFKPYLISDKTGLGTQIVVKDYNSDQLPDIAIGNKKGIALYTHKTRHVSRDEWEAAQPKLFNQ